MGKEGEVIVTNRDKKSLLEKYDIPVENLSYEYIDKCKNAKELESIVLILRSGEEGTYPHLTKHAEKRLTAVKPESAILRIAEPILTRDMLEPEKRMKLENDMSEWMSEMRLREKDLEEGRAMRCNDSISHPEIRQIKFNDSKKKEKTLPYKKEKLKRLGSCDYAEWDKYDVDTELNRIDLHQEQKEAEAKRMQKAIRQKEENLKSVSRETVVNKLTLTGTELSVMAEKEREKGNEAFKAGDYEEALQLYTSSITIDGTVNAYNNRAITFIKLQRYNEAVKDCNRVITIDYANVKALLRRGLALEYLEKRDQALADYEAVLKLEPMNKVAIAALNKLRKPCESKKVRMKIETGSEVDEKDYAAIPSSLQMNPKDRKSSASVKTAPQVCFCDNAPSSSRQPSPLPHIRDIYCTKIPEKSMKLSKQQNIFTDTKRFSTESSKTTIETQSVNFISKFNAEPNILEETDVKSNYTSKNNAKPNILKETNVKLQHFESGDNEYLNRQNGIIIEKLSAEECMNQEKLNNAIRFDSIESPYEFFRMWQSLKNCTDLKSHAKLLKALAPENLTTGNKLDGEMLSTILRCFELHFCNTKDAKLLHEYLQYLRRLKRFSIVSMFMDEKDKKVLQNILSFLEMKSPECTEELRNAYNLPL